MVITALNDGEGAGEKLQFGIQILDAAGNVLPGNRVKAGDDFRMQVTVQDLRPGGTGLFSAYVDVGYSNNIDNSEELFTLGGNDPSEFPDDTPEGQLTYSRLFNSFWTKGDFYPNGVPTAFPWRFGTDPNWLSGDGDMTPNEFDEIGGFEPFIFPPLPPLDLGNSIATLAFVQLTAELPFDEPGTITFRSNPKEGTGDVVFTNDVSNPPLVTDMLFGSATVQIYKPVYAINDTVVTNEDTAITISVLSNDTLDSLTTGPLSVASVGSTLPSHGTLQRNGNQFTYTPALNYNGSDSFTYTAIDAQGNTDTAVVSITVNAVNDNPIAVNDGATMNEDTGPLEILVLANDTPGGGSDESGQVLTITSITQPANGTATIVSGNKSVTYKPAGNFFGNDSFTYTISDGAGGVATASVSITVQNVNDAPTAVDDTFNNVQEDVTTPLNVRANDTIAPDVGETLTITAVNRTDGTQAGKTDQGGTVSIVGGQVNYLPPANFFGQDQFQYTISDGGLTDTAIVTVNVVNVNDAPIAADDNLFADERLDAVDPGTELLVLTNDKVGPDNEIPLDTITIVAVSTPDKGGTVQIINNGQSLLYTPKTGEVDFVNETFTYTIRDSGGLEDVANVIVTVEPVVRPRARDDQETVPEDGQVTIAVQGNDVFNIGFDASLFDIVDGQGPSHGTATIDGNSIVYKPDADYFGPDSFQYVIDDEFPGSVPSIGTVTVNVGSVNDAPVANDDLTLAPIPEDQQSTVIVLTNDTPGPANETEAIFVNAVVTGPSHGTIVKSADEKSFLYTPAADYHGPDSFTYTVRDAFGAVSNPATVNLTVFNVNDAPIAVDNLEMVNEDSVDNTFNVLLDDFVGPINENAIDSISLLSVGTPSQGGTAVIDGDVVKYSPAANFFGEETFTYTIIDEGGLTDTATVTVFVADVNDKPTAGDDSLMALKNFENQVLDVLANDSVFPDRPQDETLTIKGLLDASDQVVDFLVTPHGEVRVSDDRLTLIYTPDTDFETVGNDFDTFRYVVQDGRVDLQGNPGEDIGDVQIDVIDAVPSDISGVIYIDANRDGVQQPVELTLAGVEVTLTGTNIRGAAVNVKVKTDADGKFTFAGILPNAEDDTVGYSISAQTPKYLDDGRESIIDTLVDENYDPGHNGSDVFAGINLGVWGTDRSTDNYAFGEAGLSSRYIKLTQYLASTRKGLMLGSDGDGETYWFSVLQGWDGIESVSFEFADPTKPEGMASALLTVKGTNGQTYQKTLSYFKDYDFAGDPRADGCVIFLKGSAADFGFNLAYHDGEGEGPMSLDAEQLELVAAGDGTQYARGVDVVFGSDDWA